MLVASYPPHGGGSERQCALLAERLQTLGDRVEVITRHLDDEVPSDAVPVHRIRSSSRGRLGRGLSFAAGALGALLRTREQYEVVHCHGFETLALVGSAVQALAGKRLVVKVVTSGRYGDVARLARFPGGRSIGRALARADALIVLNEEARRELIDAGVAPGKITLIPNGVVIPPETHTDRSTDFLFCGRLVAQKNVDGLLRAWARSRASATRTLRIVGDGPLERDLVSLARTLGVDGSVEFRGRLADARPAIARAAAVVLFSHAEGLSNLLLESMAAGTPVVASEIPGNADLVRHEKSGLLVAPGDEAALAAAIDRIAVDPRFGDLLGHAGRAVAASKYDIAVVAERIHALYKRLGNSATGAVP
jgi:phosphatidylinositol alpha-mannosyltransferase